MIEFSNEYLKNKLEPAEDAADEKKKLLLEKMRAPFIQTDFRNTESVSVSLEHGNLSLVHQGLPEKLLAHFRKFKRLTEKERGIIELLGLQPSEFRQLTDISFQAGQDELRLEDILPRGWQVFFSANPSDSAIGSGMDDKIECIVVHGNILTRESLVALLHEIGHAREIENKTDQEKQLYREARRRFRSAGRPTASPKDANIYRPSETDLAIILESERNAWSFALKTIKPFLKMLDLTKEEMDMYMHNIALATYSDAMRDKLVKKLVEIKG